MKNFAAILTVAAMFASQAVVLAMETTTDDAKNTVVSTTDSAASEKKCSVLLFHRKCVPKHFNEKLRPVEYQNENLDRIYDDRAKICSFCGERIKDGNFTWVRLLSSDDEDNEDSDDDLHQQSGGQTEEEEELFGVIALKSFSGEPFPQSSTDQEIIRPKVTFSLLQEPLLEEPQPIYTEESPGYSEEEPRVVLRSLFLPIIQPEPSEDMFFAPELEEQEDAIGKSGEETPITLVQLPQLVKTRLLILPPNMEDWLVDSALAPLQKVIPQITAVSADNTFKNNNKMSEIASSYPNTSLRVPYTGDTSNILVYLLVCIASLTAASFLGFQIFKLHKRLLKLRIKGLNK